MKNIISSVLLLLLVASCESTTPVTTVNSGAESRKTGNSVSLSSGADRVRLGGIVKSKMPVYLSNSGTSSSLTRAALRKLEGRLAEENFVINNSRDDHFIIVSLDIDTKSGGVGGYTQIKADAEVSVKRSDRRLMGREFFDYMGDLKANKSDAEKDVAVKLSAKISDWVVEQALNARNGLVATELSINMSYFRNSSKDKMRAVSSAFSVNRFTAMSKNLKGIFDCQLIESRGDDYVFRVIYNEKNFPNGLTGRSIYSDDISVDRANPLKSLLNVVFASQQ